MIEHFNNEVIAITTTVKFIINWDSIYHLSPSDSHPLLNINLLYMPSENLISKINFKLYPVVFYSPFVVSPSRWWSVLTSLIRKSQFLSFFSRCLFQFCFVLFVVRAWVLLCFLVTLLSPIGLVSVRKITHWLLIF